MLQFQNYMQVDIWPWPHTWRVFFAEASDMKTYNLVILNHIQSQHEIIVILVHVSQPATLPPTIWLHR